MRKIVSSLFVLALLTSAGVASAATGDIQATANVLQPLSVTDNLRDLDFGDVFPGLPTSVAFTDPTSGQWRINGEAGKEVDISFTLPGSLFDGVNNLPISFAAGDAGYNTANASATATAFDPTAGTTELLDGTSGEGFVWIGGTVTPAANQPAGLYTATITMDVVYTGN